MHYCIDKEENVAADECTYQPISDTYISDDCDSWRCPVIGEFCRDYDTRTMTLHGVQVDVHDYVYYNKLQFLTDLGGGNWHIDDDDMREAFFEYHDIEEECDDDEEAA
ncbi:hypothetical protein D3C71_1745250 [compost metagenome]